MPTKRNAPGRRAEGADLFSRTDRQPQYHQPLLDATEPAEPSMWHLEAEAAFAVHQAMLLKELARPDLRANGFWMMLRADVWERFYSIFVRGDR